MEGLLHISENLLNKGSMPCIIIGLLLLIGACAYGFWMWNDERKTRKSIQSMANTQAQQLQMQQMQNGFGNPPTNSGSSATKWGR